MASILVAKLIFKNPVWPHLSYRADVMKYDTVIYMISSIIIYNHYG